MSRTNGNIGQDGEQQPEGLIGEAKKMKKSSQGIVRRTRGRDTDGTSVALGDFLSQHSMNMIGSNSDDVMEGFASDRMRWQTRVAIINSGKAANDAAIHTWRDAA